MIAFVGYQQTPCLLIVLLKRCIPNRPVLNRYMQDDLCSFKYDDVIDSTKRVAAEQVGQRQPFKRGRSGEDAHPEQPQGEGSIGAIDKTKIPDELA